MSLAGNPTVRPRNSTLKFLLKSALSLRLIVSVKSPLRPGSVHFTRYGGRHFTSRRTENRDKSLVHAFPPLPNPSQRTS